METECLLPFSQKTATPQKAEGTKEDHWRDFWTSEIGTGQQVAQYLDCYATSPSWGVWTQPTHFNPTYQRSILMLSSHLRPGLPSGLFPLGLQTIILYAFLISHMPATFPTTSSTYSTILITVCENYKLRSCSLCSFLHLPVNSFLLGSNILLRTLFSNTLIKFQPQVK
jgi:hypothetical protein